MGHYSNPFISRWHVLLFFLNFTYAVQKDEIFWYNVKHTIKGQCDWKLTVWLKINSNVLDLKSWCPLDAFVPILLLYLRSHLMKGSISHKICVFVCEKGSSTALPRNSQDVTGLRWCEQGNKMDVCRTQVKNLYWEGDIRSVC